jgi:hypothetical protein
MMDVISRRLFASKLAELRDNMPPFYPPDDDPMGYESDLIEEKVTALADRMELLFETFGLPKAQKRLSSMRKSFKDKDDRSLWTIDEPPWRQGQYFAVVMPEELLDNYLFVYSDAIERESRRHGDYQQLVQLLHGVERSFSISHRYPADEPEFQRMVDAILICRFPKLPSVPT